MDTERSTEEIGNPKGKAVEHFTNLIAEMRSYGQGVIIAEQIPTKLAPDVIKNSSNKIIQRLVAADDQNVVANAIGLNDKEAIYIGNLTVGRALCHKEGMSMPVNVTIQLIEEHTIISDAMLCVGDHSVRVHHINTSMMKECIAERIDLLALKILNSILLQNGSLVEKSICDFRKKARSDAKKKNVELIPGDDENEICAELLSEAIVGYLLNGAYHIKKLVDNTWYDALYELIYCPDSPKLNALREILKEAYGDDPVFRGKHIICHRVYNQMDKNTDLEATIRDNFIFSDDSDKDTIRDIKEMIYHFESGNKDNIF